MGHLGILIKFGLWLLIIKRPEGMPLPGFQKFSHYVASDVTAPYVLQHRKFTKIAEEIYIC